MAAELSALLDRRTTKTRAILFGALRSVGHAQVAKDLGLAESSFSEWLQKHADRIAQMLTAIGHKPVPIENVCYPPDYVERLRYFAELGIKQAPASLEFEDGE